MLSTAPCAPDARRLGLGASANVRAAYYSHTSFAGVLQGGLAPVDFAQSRHSARPFRRRVTVSAVRRSKGSQSKADESVELEGDYKTGVGFAPGRLGEVDAVARELGSIEELARNRPDP